MKFSILYLSIFFSTITKKMKRMQITVQHFKKLLNKISYYFNRMQGLNKLNRINETNDKSQKWVIKTDTTASMWFF